MCGTTKKSQICSVSIDSWSRYTLQEIVIRQPSRAQIAHKKPLCLIQAHSTTPVKFKLGERHCLAIAATKFNCECAGVPMAEH
jgi:hypothetical protein